MEPDRKQPLEQVLGKHLERVPAPPGLWDRVQAARSGAEPEQGPGFVRPKTGWSGWGWAGAAAAAVAGLGIALGGWTLWQELADPPSVEALAVEALEDGPEQLAFLSSEAADIRLWLRDNSGIDIPLPPRHSPLVEIVGARVLNPGQPVAEIAYRVGEDRASLLVARDPSGTRSYPNHEARASDPFQAARVTSWSMRGQSYTLAWNAQGEFRVACLLCHPGGAPLLDPTLMN